MDISYESFDEEWNKYYLIFRQNLLMFIAYVISLSVAGIWNPELWNYYCILERMCKEVVVAYFKVFSGRKCIEIRENPLNNITDIPLEIQTENVLNACQESYRMRQLIRSAHASQQYAAK